MLEKILQLLTEIRLKVEDLPGRLKLSAQQIAINVLSELSKSMGLIMAGEFRVGNGKEPGNGFTGVRMAYPPMTYGSSEYPFASVNNDTLEVGIGLTDGKLYAGQGAVVLDTNGMSIYSSGIGTDRIKFYASSSELGGYIYLQQAANINILRITGLDSASAANSSLQFGSFHSPDDDIKALVTFTNGDISWRASGSFQIYPLIDSTTFFQLRRQSDNAIVFGADTTNRRFGIGVPVPSETLHVGGNIRIGTGTAATDYNITFDGETNDGTITWMEDENYFAFDKGIQVTGNVSATTYGVGATAGIDATVTYVDTLLGAKTLTFTKGILTAQV